MNNNKVEVKNGGIGFLGVLQIVFIVLKLIGKINWSWGLVLAPLWAPLALTVLACVIVIILKLIFNL